MPELLCALWAKGRRRLISRFFFRLHTYFYVLQFLDVKLHNPKIHAWNQLQRISSKPSLLDLIFRQNYNARYGLLAAASHITIFICKFMIVCQHNFLAHHFKTWRLSWDEHHCGPIYLILFILGKWYFTTLSQNLRKIRID